MRGVFDTKYSNLAGNMMRDPGVQRIAILEGVRTPLCRARKGALKDATPDRLLASALSGLMASFRSEGKLTLDMVDDIVVGNVLQPGGGAAMARMAMLRAGFPETTTLATTNRQCSSGLQALAAVAGSILLGTAQVGIAAGVESMTHDSIVPPNIDAEFLKDSSPAADCMVPMGVTSDTLAKEFGISREKQDAFSLASHRKAHVAQARGLFSHEIVPVMMRGGSVVDVDDGIRSDCSAAGLAALKPRFSRNADATTTAGNASQLTDGAAALLVMTEAHASTLGLMPKVSKTHS